MQRIKVDFIPLFPIKLQINSSDEESDNPGKKEIDNRRGNQREESLVSIASDNIAHFRQVFYCDVAYNGCRF